MTTIVGRFERTNPKFDRGKGKFERTNPEVRQSRAGKCANRCMFLGKAVKARWRDCPTERIRRFLQVADSDRMNANGLLVRNVAI
jgi:hypothetical protein